LSPGARREGLSHPASKSRIGERPIRCHPPGLSTG
jgi:hypothetical protein